MSEQTRTLTQRAILALLLGVLLLLSYQVLYIFLVPVAWAMILVYVTWPVYHRLCRHLPGRLAGSALLMTLVLGAAFVLPAIWLIALLRAELPLAYQAAAAALAQGPRILPEFIVQLPWLGPELERFLDKLSGEPAAVREQLATWAEPWLGQLATILGDIGRNAVKFGVALVTAFFLYRDGEALLYQARLIMQRFVGERTHAYLATIGATLRAVLYGLVLTALAQGLLAGLGYWAAGVEAPVLLGAVTAVLALIPFAPPLVWGSVGIWLLLTGQTFAGIGLLLWGALVVSWVDNLIRPLVISTATRIPFLLVMFGVLGGIAAFGLVGLFFGPVIMAILLAVWREWVDEQLPKEHDPSNEAGNNGPAAGTKR
jgi:predicted PurR-regulated permease PerM